MNGDFCQSLKIKAESLKELTWTEYTHAMVYNSFNQFILGIEENSPLGKDWSTVDAEPMKHVSYKISNFWWKKNVCTLIEKMWPTSYT